MGWLLGTPGHQYATTGRALRNPTRSCRVLTCANATAFSSYAHMHSQAALQQACAEAESKRLADLAARPSLIPSLCTHFTRAGIEWRR